VVIRKNCRDVKLAYKAGTKRKTETEIIEGEKERLFLHSIKHMHRIKISYRLTT
jgi:hypothetical protein